MSRSSNSNTSLHGVNKVDWHSVLVKRSDVSTDLGHLEARGLWNDGERAWFVDAVVAGREEDDVVGVLASAQAVSLSDEPSSVASIQSATSTC